MNRIKHAMLLLAAALLIGITSAATAAGPDAVVKIHNGRPTVFIDGVPTALTGFNPSCRNRERFFETMPFFYTTGIHTYIIHPATTRDFWSEMYFWRGDVISSNPEGIDAPDVWCIDKQAKEILKNDPDAWIIVRFTPFPPRSWRMLHPQEWFVTEDATVSDMPSFASDLFWKTVADASAAIITYSENQPWSSRVIGYTNFGISEGQHLAVARGWMYDHNPLMLQRLREFLRAKYKTNEALRAAYGDPTLTFDTVQVPRDRLRGAVPEVTQNLYWQPREENAAIRDYLELTRDLWHKQFRVIQEAMDGAAKRNVIFFHDAMKQNMQGWNLDGFFAYGFQEKVSWNNYFPDFVGGSGCINEAELLDLPGVDGLMTPNDYQARGLGGVFQPEGIADSAVLRGKLFFCENDMRALERNEIGNARTDEEYIALTWRDAATVLTHGYNLYWMDLIDVNHNTPGPRQDSLRRQIEVMNESVNIKHADVPGIAMIIDDASVLETNGSGNFLNEAVMWEWRMGIARCGVPFRIYVFEDLKQPNFPDHRVFYFPNMFKVDDERMAILEQKIFRDGHVVVWGPGSGISDGVTIGPENAAKLTGFSFEMMPASSQRRILLSNFDNPITRGFDADTFIGGPLAYGPVLVPTDGTELGIGWLKGGFNHTGLAVKEFGRGASGNGTSGARGEGDYASVFTVAAQLPADLWRNLARYGGAHIWSDSGDILLADESIVALHSLKSEKKVISLPRASRVTDLATGKVIAKNTKEITFDLKAPETRIFLMEAVK